VQTRNPLAVAMATFLQRLPWLMFGLYAGVLADRVSRRAIVIVTGLVRVTILVLLIASILTGRVDTAVVLAALFLFGVNETFGETASTTVLPIVSEAVCVLAGVLLIARVRLPAPVRAAAGRARVRDDISEGWRWPAGSDSR
jgi:MFS family permease